MTKEKFDEAVELHGEIERLERQLSFIDEAKKKCRCVDIKIGGLYFSVPDDYAMRFLREKEDKTAEELRELKERFLLL